MKRARPVKPDQVWEFPWDKFTPHYGMCLVLRPSLNPELYPGAYECFIIMDPENNWGEGKVITLWLSESNWKPLEV